MGRRPQKVAEQLRSRYGCMNALRGAICINPARARGHLCAMSECRVQTERSYLLRLALVIAFTALVCARLPDVSQHGRFWAEEGRLFYYRASTMPWHEALLAPFAGYLNLSASAAAIIARYTVPVEYAPWVTTGLGLLAQCCPAVILVTSSDVWLRSRLVLVGGLLIIATAPLCEEIWLQTIGAQFHLTLCCALILALDAPKAGRRWFRYVLLFLGPLSGPSAIALIPLFLVKSVIEKEWARLSQCIVIIAGGLIQLVGFYGHEAGRSYGIAPTILVCVIFIKHLVVPLAGKEIASNESFKIRELIAVHRYPVWQVFITAGAFALLAATLTFKRAKPAIWLFTSACVLAIISYYGAINGGQRLLLIGNDERYSFVPEVLVALSLLNVAGSARPHFFSNSYPNGIVAWLSRAIVVWLIAVGCQDVASPISGSAHGPNWRHEIELWRRDHTHKIAIWPQGWFMSLN